MRVLTLLAGLAVFAFACGDPTDHQSSESETGISPGSDSAAADTLRTDTAPADTESAGEVTPTHMKHVLCHGLTNASAETITVEETDVAAHLDHGDVRGPCSPLTSTLVPDSHTIVDCDGREVTPADPTVDTFVFLHDAVDVHLVDCVVRFDFAAFIVGGGEHVIEGNQLHVATEAVVVLASHDDRIADNLIRYGDVGIGFDRDADRNVVEGNDMAPSRAALGAAWPGHTERAEDGGRASIVIVDYPFPAVANAFINGELVQIPNRDTTSDDNIFRDNDIIGGNPAGIGVMVRANRTLVQRNRITGGVNSIASFGYDDGTAIELPGTCSLAPARFCGSDADCDLAGYDLVPNGTCEGTSVSHSDTRVIATRIEDNEVSGDYDVGILQMLTRNAVVRGNRVTGGNVGIQLLDYSVAAITVTDNVVSNNHTGLQIIKGLTTAWGADVTGNDFTDNDVQIESDIPARVDGNYWGHSACPGFVADDAVGPGVDCAPYTTSVAGGVPAGAAACAAATRPRELEGTCGP